MSDIHLAGVHRNTIIRFHLDNSLCISLFAINNTFPALQPPIPFFFIFFLNFLQGTPSRFDPFILFIGFYFVLSHCQGKGILFAGTYKVFF